MVGGEEVCGVEEVKVCADGWMLVVNVQVKE